MNRYYPLLFLLLISSCSLVDSLADLISPKTPWEKYTRSLRREKGKEHPDLQAWQAANASALHDDAALVLPSKVRLALRPWVAPDATACGFRFQLDRGRGLTAAFAPNKGVVFGELYAIGQDHEGTYFELITAWDTIEHELHYEAENSGEYLLLLQSKLYQQVEGELIVKEYAPLTFPVAGVDNRAAQSFWGAPRDGGKRKHEGVDIFAPKGTNLLAVADGEVTRVKEGGLGGKVVWCWAPEYNLSIYYAHLDEQLVSKGDRIRRGEIIGTVGNTGNAHNTPPHLHFGIYPNGQQAVDPWPFIRMVEASATSPQIDYQQLGKEKELKSAKQYNIRKQPHPQATITRQLNAGESVFILGAIGEYSHVRTQDGTTGFMA
ncbi:MAG: M23 family metallopeptidase, partial [Bacteroidota bacterium]